MNSPFLTPPAVFAAGSNYQIMSVTDTPLVYWVEVNNHKYYDASNGVLRSACRAHRGGCAHGRVGQGGKIYALLQTGAG